MEIPLYHGIEPLVPQMIPVPKIEPKAEPRPKVKKTSQEKRRNRSLTSPWHTKGPKKQARTLQWRDNQEPRLFRVFKQVLDNNQINLKELHGALLWYFRQEAKFDEQENWGDSSTDEQAVSRRPQQHVSSADVKFSTAAPLEPQCPLSPTPTVLPADEFEEVEIEELPRRLPKVPVAAEPEKVEIVEIPPSCVSHQGCSGEAPMVKTASSHHEPSASPRDGDIPFTGPLQRSIPVRDIEELLSDVAPLNNHMWIRLLEDIRPEDVPYSIFGINAFSYKGQLVDTAQLPSSCSAPTAHLDRFRGVWADPDEDSSEAGSSDPPALSNPSPLLQRTLFTFCPVGSHDDCLVKIQCMWLPEFFSPKADEAAGFRWSLGMGKNSSGVKVRQRFRSSGFWSARLTISSIAELSYFTNPHFPEMVVKAVEILPVTNSLTRGFPRGSLYKMPVADPPPNSGRFWHGSNLYVT